MTTVTTGATRRATPPSWPLLMLGALFVLATLSIVQGIVDVLIPVTQGAEPFGFLLEQTARFGPGFFVAYIFVHNLGLACLVPGYGFLAAKFERDTPNRFVIGLVLAASVACSLLVALEFILQARERFDLPTALAIFAAEAAAVLTVAVMAARELRGFIPTRTYQWSLITPFRNLRAPLAFAVVTLVLVSVIEALIVLR